MNQRQQVTPMPFNPSARHEKGSSLLEVMVAILLVSVGLLGIAGLSSATFSYNKAAQLRLTGLALVNDYADRARVNVYGYDLGGYDLTLSSTATAPTQNADEKSDSKAAANAVALADRAHLLTEVAARLPQGKAVVASTPSAGARDLDIWLLWKEPQLGEVDEDDDPAGYAAFSLFKQGQDNCPSDLSEDDLAVYSCMYFKVSL